MRRSGLQRPRGFRFGSRPTSYYSHQTAQRDGDFVPRFLSTIEPLAQAGKLGPVLFQLPPNLKADVKLLERILPTLPRAVQTALNSQSLVFTDEIFNLLKAAIARLCCRDRRARHTRLVTLTSVTTATASPVTRVKSAASWSIECASTLRRTHVFAYFKHEETPEGALYAVEILKETITTENTENHLISFEKEFPLCPLWLKPFRTHLITFPRSIRA